MPSDSVSSYFCSFYKETGSIVLFGKDFLDEGGLDQFKVSTGHSGADAQKEVKERGRRWCDYRFL